jgi:hypothetical protein
MSCRQEDVIATWYPHRDGVFQGSIELRSKTLRDGETSGHDDHGHQTNSIPTSGNDGRYERETFDPQDRDGCSIDHTIAKYSFSDVE